MYQKNPATGRYLDANALESERTYGLFNHLIGLLSLADMTILGLIGALVMWRIKAGESPFLDDHGREAVNFQITMLIYVLVGTAAIAIVSLGILVLPWIAFLFILRIYGAAKGAGAAQRGEFYRYPMCIRFLG